MRRFTFIFIAVLTFVISASAQTALLNRAFETGTRAAQAKEYENAIADYRRAILFSETEKRSDDFLARIHFNIGVCFYKLKQNAEAVEEFTEAVRLSKGNYQKAFYALGMAHSELKNWHKAKSAFRKAVELKPDDGEAWFDLAMVFLVEKDFDSAKPAFQKSIKYKSAAIADAHNNIGVILVLQNNFLLAENEFKTALTESNGKSVEAKNNLQFCRLYKRNLNRNLLAKLSFSRKDKQGE
jgi:tetratricopeptide (TPR) repeat protein